MKMSRRNRLASGLTGLLLGASLLGGGCNSFLSEDIYPVSTPIGEIETGMRKALDPDGRYASAKSYVQRQVSQEVRWLEDNEGEVLTDVKFVSPDKLSMVNYVDNEPQSGVIIGGDRGWLVDYPAKRVTPLNEDRMRLVKTLTLIANPDSRLSQVFEDIKIEGCRMDDKEYYKLICKIDKDNPGIPTLNIYVDKEDFLIRMYRIGETVSKVVRYGRHEGVMIPVEIETDVDGRKTRVTVVDYKLDVKIPADEFYPPIFR